MLLEVFAEMKRDGRMPLRLVLAGHSAPAESDLRFIRECGFADGIEVRVGASAQEIAELHRNAFVFALPSDEEGYGMVLLEAMASGRPVVSTDCGGPADIVTARETGFLTPVRDRPALHSCFAQLVNSPELAERLGAAGRRRVESVFSHDAAIRPVLSAYEDLLS